MADAGSAMGAPGGASAADPPAADQTRTWVNARLGGEWSAPSAAGGLTPDRLTTLVRIFASLDSLVKVGWGTGLAGVRVCNGGGWGGVGSGCGAVQGLHHYQALNGRPCACMCVCGGPCAHGVGVGGWLEGWPCGLFGGRLMRWGRKRGAVGAQVRQPAGTHTICRPPTPPRTPRGNATRHHHTQVRLLLAGLFVPRLERERVLPLLRAARVQAAASQVRNTAQGRHRVAGWGA